MTDATEAEVLIAKAICCPHGRCIRQNFPGGCTAIYETRIQARAVIAVIAKAKVEGAHQ